MFLYPYTVYTYTITQRNNNCRRLLLHVARSSNSNGTLLVTIDGTLLRWLHVEMKDNFGT